MSPSACQRPCLILHRLLLALMLAGVFFASSATSAGAATIYGGKWQQLETRHVVLLFENSEVLAGFDRKIRFSRTHDATRQLYQAGGQSGESPLAAKVDALFMRVQEILDMRQKMEKVTIKIYPDSATLQEVYRRLFHRKNAMRAWYLFEKNTIYVAVDDLHEGMLAHEMAHAIIDHFFSVRPPSATAEILARYVDKHINK